MSESDRFIIRFNDQQFSPALRIDPNGDAQTIIDTFGLLSPRPTIFITGGASAMSESDIERTRVVMESGVAAFAAQHNITIVDGGTEAGVMRMVGLARKANNYKFPLVGIAPYDKVSYPGFNNPQAEAVLEEGHSHFVLVNSDQWGGESQMIVNLTKAIANRQKPMMGILINGGRIAERDVYLATTQGDNRIPILILEGSGRVADDISTAFKTQRTDNSIIQAIIRGGDIRLTPLEEGVPALLAHLEKHFLKS